MLYRRGLVSGQGVRVPWRIGVRSRCACTMEDWCQVKVCVYHGGLVSGQGVRVPLRTDVRSRCACTMEDWCQVKVCVYHGGLVSGQGRCYTVRRRGTVHERTVQDPLFLSSSPQSFIDVHCNTITIQHSIRNRVL